MTPWDMRPIEVASLLNPAFCGWILMKCIETYEAEANSAFSYPLAFLTLPILLHRETREQISPRQRVPMHAWLQEHPQAKIGFAERTRSLIPVTNESLALYLQNAAVALDESGSLRIRKHIDVDRFVRDYGELGDIMDCFRKAAIVGRWFARGGTPTTIFATWGVKP